MSARHRVVCLAGRCAGCNATRYVLIVPCLPFVSDPGAVSLVIAARSFGGGLVAVDSVALNLLEPGDVSRLTLAGRALVAGRTAERRC